ncbi:hypothetical protein TWF569_001082 [Orbilia oligospora]|uniref:Non-structural maintenance of chromosomes element 1 homolog n=1 Tax=Orbilia oligospora TaxID=2813651 RepID=A0A7C8NNL5_ORBOL|nr:hypothetical protein TWF103_003457 [Orbilia oligospora]KAF3097002.1 hypothetical protein TWF102_006447 [Orbilia oligospora]KAF3125153.1 hypothetical protein TWF569_001082 [Orbilia oligospora]
MSVYSNIHRAFLQALLIRPFIDVQEGRELLAAIKSAEAGSDVSIESVSPKEFRATVHTIQNTISSFDLDIREMPDQEDGNHCYALVNDSNDDIIRFATTHTPDEISYFKRLLDEMFDTSNTIYAEIMAVKSMRAISLNKNPPSERENQEVIVENANGEEERQTIAGAGIGLTKQEAEDCLTRFVDEGWLERDRAGYHFLSTRALLELERYLSDTYNIEEEEEQEDGTIRKGPKKLRIKHCGHCRYIHTIGQRCSDMHCGYRLHNHCAEAMFSRLPARECGTCKKEWTGEPVGPRAGVSASSGASGLRRAKGRDSEGVMPQRLSKAVKRSIEKSKGRRSTMFGDGDDDGEVDEDTDATTPLPRRPRNSLGRRNRTSLGGVEDEGEDNEGQPPRKLTRILNGTSSRRTSALHQRSNSPGEDEPTESSHSAAAHIKRESLSHRREDRSEEDDDENEEEELPRRLQKASLQSKRR